MQQYCNIIIKTCLPSTVMSVTLCLSIIPMFSRKIRKAGDVYIWNVPAVVLSTETKAELWFIVRFSSCWIDLLIYCEMRLNRAYVNWKLHYFLWNVKMNRFGELNRHAYFFQISCSFFHSTSVHNLILLVLHTMNSTWLKCDWMSIGVTVANKNTRHKRPYHTVDRSKYIHYNHKRILLYLTGQQTTAGHKPTDYT